jgi:hypothetical protein
MGGRGNDAAERTALGSACYVMGARAAAGETQRASEAPDSLAEHRCVIAGPYRCGEALSTSPALHRTGYSTAVAPNTLHIVAFLYCSLLVLPLAPSLAPSLLLHLPLPLSSHPLTPQLVRCRELIPPSYRHVAPQERPRILSPMPAGQTVPAAFSQDGDPRCASTRP